MLFQPKPVHGEKAVRDPNWGIWLNLPDIILFYLFLSAFPISFHCISKLLTRHARRHVPLAEIK